jgi:hypothetical protein
MKTKIILVFVVLLAACSGPATVSEVPAASDSPSSFGPTATLPALEMVPVVPAAGEILSLSQTGPGSSDPFTLNEKTMVRVNWEQASSGDFLLAIVNEDPAQAGTPYGRVVFESTTGPSAMLSEYEFIAGQYRVVVEKADGPWKVWLEYVGQ